MKRILLWCLLPVSIILHAEVEIGTLSFEKKEPGERNKAWNPPANDNCENAVLLTVNPDLNCGVLTAGTTLNATDSGLAASPCDGNPDGDVWYKFTATASAHMISLKNVVSVGSPFSTDTYFQVLSGACGNLTSIKCSDPDEDIVTGLTVGETYYIRVYSYYGGGMAQSFNICVGTLPPPPSNDECSGAIALTINSDMNCGSKLSGTTFGATDSGVDPCHGESDDDVWYKFTAVQASHVISISNSNSVIGYDSLVFEIFSGSCGALTSISCSDDDSVIAVNGLTPGEAYYIRIYSHDYGYNTFDICVRTLPPPPVNDECTGAITLAVNPDLNCGNKLSGNNISATDSGIVACVAEAKDDVWYQFTAVETSHVITLSNIESVLGYAGPIFEVFSGSCGTLTSISCSDYGTVKILTGLTPGETYYIRVFDSEIGHIFFDICIGNFPPPPANDECTGAIALMVNPDMNCGSKLSGSTVSATDSGITSCDGEPDDDVWYKFTATGTSHVISLSNIGSVLGDSIPIFEVFSGSCGTLSSMVCSNYGDSPVLTGLIPGATYYIRVFGDLDGFVTFDICIGTVPPPPVNDACSGALAATSFPYSYTQSDAAGATNNNGFIETCASGGMNDGTWFTFTGNGNPFDISVTVPAGSTFDPEMGVYSGSCDNLTCEVTMDEGAMGEGETVSVSTVAGTVYYVNVGHYSSTSDELEGTFTITISNNSLGTSEVSAEKNKVKVYPNPFTEVLNITDISKIQSITISDMSGKQVKNIVTPSSVLHLGDLKQGMYLVILNMKDGSRQTVKVIRK